MSQIVKELLIEISLNDAKLKKLRGDMNRLQKSMNSLSGDKLDIATERLDIMSASLNKSTNKAEKLSKELQNVGLKNELSNVRDYIQDIGHSLKMGNISALPEQITDARTQLMALARSANSLKLQPQIKKANQELDIMEKRLNATQAQINKTSTAFGAFWESSRLGALGFNGTLLSILFFGMEMKRVFGGALRGVFDGYKKIIPESHKFNVMTTRLSANWEFFKFQLADAMANSRLFQRFIQFLIQMIQKFQGLGENTKIVLVFLLAIGVVIGTVLFGIGVWGMGIAAISDSFTAIGKALPAIKTGIAAISTAKFFTMAAIIAVVVGLVLLAAKSFSTFRNSSSYASDAVNNLKSGFLDLINYALDPIMSLFGGMDIELKNMGEVFVYFGAILQNVFANIGGGLATLVLGFKQGVTFIKGIYSGLVEALTKAALKIAEGWKYVLDTFGKDTTKAQESIDDLQETIDNLNLDQLSLKDDLQKEWEEFEKISKKFENAIVSPDMAVQEYRIQQALEESRRQDELKNQRNAEAQGKTVVNNLVVVDGTVTADTGGQTDKYQTMLDDYNKQIAGLGGS